jgi:hypothetical protein
MNIYDYIKWRGDLLIDDTHPLNEVDKLILSRISYLPFEHIKLSKRETLGKLCEKFIEVDKNKYLIEGDYKFVELLIDSPRFNKLVITDYEYSYDKELEEQFGAVSIHLRDDLIYISFLGTDEKIAGWKEDFNLCTLENIPSQLDALDYLNRMNLKYKNYKFRLGGHSKGGNIAIYAGLMYENKNIISLDCYDGPGFFNSFYDNIKNKDLLKNSNCYLPKDSIVGRILEHKENIIVVDSSGNGIWQHDIFTWYVDKYNIIKYDNLSSGSNAIYETLKNMIDLTTASQRKIFFDSIFSLIYSTGKDSFKEVSLLKSIPKLLSTYKNFDENDRKLVNKFIVEFIKTYIINYGKNLTK